MPLWPARTANFGTPSRYAGLRTGSLDRRTSRSRLDLGRGTVVFLVATDAEGYVRLLCRAGAALAASWPSQAFRSSASPRRSREARARFTVDIVVVSRLFSLTTSSLIV
jgi:hypothetical protein